MLADCFVETHSLGHLYAIGADPAGEARDKLIRDAF